MKKQFKKLRLNKETLRDLTAHNVDEVNGGQVLPTMMGCGISRMCPSFLGCTLNLGCTHTCHHCHGKTFNKKCGF